MITVPDAETMMQLGEHIGLTLKGGETIELIGDVGAGKTTFVKGLARGLAIDEDVQSPSFTISRVYEARDNLSLHHYDFYRLQEAGVMSYDLSESVHDNRNITVIEWAETVQDVLPRDRCVIKLSYAESSDDRYVSLSLPRSLQYMHGEGA